MAVDSLVTSMRLFGGRGASYGGFLQPPQTTQKGDPRRGCEVKCSSTLGPANLVVLIETDAEASKGVFGRESGAEVTPLMSHAGSWCVDEIFDGDSE
jgi:hypothetical protein